MRLYGAGRLPSSEGGHKINDQMERAGLSFDYFTTLGHSNHSNSTCLTDVYFLYV